MNRRASKIREVYRSIRKPGAPPTRVETDRRGKLRHRDDEREMERYAKARRQEDPEREE